MNNKKDESKEYLEYLSFRPEKIAKLKAKSKKYGATDFGISKNAKKKYYVVYDGKTINFGSRGMSDFTIHRDEKRRKNYQSRHSKIKMGDGRYAYKLKSSPSFWSYNILW
jgi:hypothetical protein